LPGEKTRETNHPGWRREGKKDGLVKWSFIVDIPDSYGRAVERWVGSRNEKRAYVKSPGESFSGGRTVRMGRFP